MRGKGEGSIFKDKSSGLWTAIIELPAHDGKRRRKPIRRKTKADLLAAMAEMKADLKLRGDLPTKGQTVEQWFTYWLREIAQKEIAPKTLDGYRTLVTKHIIPTIGKVKLEAMSAAHVRRVHDRITKDLGLSSTYALLAHRVMSVSFKIAVREGRMSRNPAELTSAPRKTALALEALNLEEAIAVLKHVEAAPLGARWAMALLTGARRGEVLGLERDRVSDVVDLSWQLLRLPLTESTGKPDVRADYEYRHLTGGLYLTRPKSSAGWRVIPMFEPLRSILHRHFEIAPANPWGLVFTKNDRPLDPDQDSKRWRTVLKATGIQKDVRLHDLRHTAVDLLTLAGVPDDVQMQIVGHSTRAMTQSYRSRGDRPRIQASMDAFGALFTTPGDASSGTRALGE